MHQLRGVPRIPRRLQPVKQIGKMPAHAPFQSENGVKSTKPSTAEHDSRWLRNLMELSILFVMAVIMLRGFFLEGYLISTGSMAPGLLGLHKQIACPSCQHSFAFGVTFDESVDDADAGINLSDRYATCPNCGQANINVSSTPTNHGDQLLVHKGVFELRRPRRWETVVFRNPTSPGEAYLKRVVGLPGESLQVIDGDLFIEGSVARKDYQTQKDMRIEVFDMAHLVPTDEWEIPWKTSGRWQLLDRKLTCANVAATESGNAAVDWLQLRNWRWSGGNHYSEVPLQGESVEADWQNCQEEMESRPLSWVTRLEFDRERMVLRLRGVMPYQMQRDLVLWADSNAFRQAVYRLAALSHLSPVTDRYGYNSLVSSPEFPVHDLMVEADIEWSQPPTAVVLQVPVGSEIFRVELHLKKGIARLLADGAAQPVRESRLNLSTTTDSNNVSGRLKIEVSNFDRRVLLVVNGVPLFEPLDVGFRDTDALQARPSIETFGLDGGDGAAQRTAKFVNRQNRWALGIAGGEATVESLRLYRDVHYTPGRRANGVDSPYRVSENTYFVQGDNSPVSSDSRSWPNPEVPHKLLVGKPFVVHLPSKPGKVMIGGFQLPIRIPDFGRIRYIR